MFVDRVVQKYGRLDVAFNNAGITLEKPLHEYNSAEWDAVLSTNLRGVFLAMKYEIPYMLANGGGHIVVTSSSNAIATTVKRSAYTASKRGLVGLVQSAALDYVDKGIRINALIQGTTDTDLVRRVHETTPTPIKPVDGQTCFSGLSCIQVYGSHHLKAPSDAIPRLC